MLRQRNRHCITLMTFLAGTLAGLMLNLSVIVDREFRGDMEWRRIRELPGYLRGGRISKPLVREESEAERLSRKIRILCMVMTTPEHHESRAIHVMATWGRRCTKLLFVSEQLDSRLPIILINVTTGRKELSVKHRLAWDRVYTDHFNDTDWFYKVDDDAYVIMENLRRLLANQNSSDPVYFGHHFRILVRPSGYLSGGSGYVLSREALRRFGTRAPGIYREELHTEADDLEMGHAMQKLGVRVGDSRDSSGRITFYVERPEDYLVGPIPKWLFKYDRYRPLKGLQNISSNAIAFHHLTEQHMYSMEYFIYHLQVYGLRDGISSTLSRRRDSKTRR